MLILTLLKLEYINRCTEKDDQYHENFSKSHPQIAILELAKLYQFVGQHINHSMST